MCKCTVGINVFFSLYIYFKLHFFKEALSNLLLDVDGELPSLSSISTLPIYDASFSFFICTNTLYNNNFNFYDTMFLAVYDIIMCAFKDIIGKTYNILILNTCIYYQLKEKYV